MLTKALLLSSVLLPSFITSSCVTMFGDGNHHDLHGKIWSTSQKDFVDKQELRKAMTNARVILIGERHDNPEHKKIQLDLIQSLPQQNLKALSFEHMDRRQQVALSQFNKGGQQLSELRAKLNWEKSGWPPWEMYQEIFQYSKNAGLPLYAANIDKGALKSVMDLGYEIVFDLKTIEQMDLKKPLPSGMQEELAAEIEASHCHKMDQVLKEKMVRAQRARDAFMGLSLHRRIDEKHASILLAGNGHVRKDRGVPLYLQRLGVEQKDIVSIGLVEITPNYPEQPQKNLPYDFVFFTKSVDQQDPCDKYKEQLKKFDKKAKVEPKKERQ